MLKRIQGIIVTIEFFEIMTDEKSGISKNIISTE